MPATKTTKRTKIEKPIVRGPARKRSPRRSRRNGVAPKSGNRPGFLYRWFRRLALLGVVLATLPFALILAYAPSGVQPISTLMVRDWATDGGYVREWVPLEEFPDVLIASVLASEDGKFCQHNGVDWSAVATVVQQAFKGERPRGASTVTMQTVKNLFLPANRSVVRKAIEVPLAGVADFVWGKRRTLEIYLNIAEWAPNHFGAGAAARVWFGKDVRSLNRSEAARLAVTLPNPYIRNPADPGPRVMALARLNEQRAREMDPYLGCLDEVG